MEPEKQASESQNNNFDSTQPSNKETQDNKYINFIKSKQFALLILLITIFGVLMWGFANNPTTSMETEVNNSPDTAKEISYIDVPLFFTGNSVQYFNSNEQQVETLFELEESLEPILATNIDKGLQVIALQRSEDLPTSQTKIVLVNEQGDEEVFETNESAGIGSQHFAYDNESNTIFLEEYYETDSAITYNTNIISVDLDTGARTVLLDEAAFNNTEISNGPYFPVDVLNGELIIGETSCYECSGARLTSLYTIDDGLISKISETTITVSSAKDEVTTQNEVSSGTVFSHPNINYIASIAHSYDYYFEPPTEDTQIVTPQGAIINERLSTLEFEYQLTGNKDDVMRSVGLDIRNNTFLGIINEWQSEEYNFKSFATLDRNGKLNEINVDSSRLSGENAERVIYATRDDNGLFYITERFLDSDYIINAYFLPLNEDEESSIVNVEIDQSSKSVNIDLGIAEIKN